MKGARLVMMLSGDSDSDSGNGSGSDNDSGPGFTQSILSKRVTTDSGTLLCPTPT